MKFCSECGSPVVLRIPDGDNLPRYICPVCGAIHYQNPKMVVGCIPEWENKVLLCRRAIEPKYGLWTLPAGFMENGETTLEGAARETWEEAGARRWSTTSGIGAPAASTSTSATSAPADARVRSQSTAATCSRPSTSRPTRSQPSWLSCTSPSRRRYSVSSSRSSRCAPMR